MKAFLVFTVTETSFTTTSYSWIFLAWSVNYANLVYKLLHFENVKIHKHCLYWRVFSTDIYRKMYFNNLLLFSYICWPVNCMCWVSKCNNFFLTCMETEARFIFDGFNIVLYGKFISDSLILFLFLFIWSVNCWRDFFSHFVISKLYELKLWIIEHTSEISCNVSINLYWRPCGIAIHGKFYLYCLYQTFLLCKLSKSGL